MENNAPIRPVSPEQCQSCLGTGEVGSEFGPESCPDCGGAGFLPSPHVLVEWRARDALTKINALANELDDGGGIATRIRFTANQALRLYTVKRDQK